MLRQVQLDDSILNDLLSQRRWDTLDLSVEPKMLLHSHKCKDSVMLWAVSDHFSRLLKLLKHVVACNRDLTACRDNISRQALESS